MPLLIALVLALLTHPAIAEESESVSLPPAVQSLITAAERGDAQAQSRLAGVYYQGQAVAQDYALAASWYRKAAEQGERNAQYHLGYMNFRDQGVAQDYRQSVFWYRKAAEQGDARAQSNLGEMYFDGMGVEKSDAEAVFWYRRAAEQGDAKAQSRLASMYYEGRGVTEDYRSAAFWYRKAAEQQVVHARPDTNPLPHDNYRQAASWYRKSEELAVAQAQYQLGVMHQKGQGIAQDYVEAHKWFNIAGAAGSESAREQRELLEKLMLPVQIVESQRRASIWMKEHTVGAASPKKTPPKKDQPKKAK